LLLAVVLETVLVIHKFEELEVLEDLAMLLGDLVVLLLVSLDLAVVLAAAVAVAVDLVLLAITVLVERELGEAMLFPHNHLIF
jgi:hypothetical protein